MREKAKPLLAKEEMARETEIKLRIADVEAFQRELARLGAKTVFRGSGRIHEMNLIFDTPRGALAKKAQLLRIRTETPVTQDGVEEKTGAKRVVLTFKKPAKGRRDPEQRSPGLAKGQDAARYKVREEVEMVVNDSATLEAIFEGLGMQGWFRYEKYRTTYRLPARWAKALLIELDETPVGNFVELEGPPKVIDRAAKALGYTRAEYVLKNYLILYREGCQKRGVAPGDMVFRKRQRGLR